MKKVFLKVLTLSLVTALSVSIFNGCNKKVDNTSTDSTKTNADSKPVTLKVEVFDRGTTGQTPPTDNYWTKWIKEKVKSELNIDLEYVAVPRSQEVDKINVLMASNQAPDISCTYDVNTITNYYKNGGLTELTSSLEKYGQDLKKFLGAEVLKSGQYSGKQFSLPARRANTAKFATYIRKDWLDKLNLPEPKTLDEFYNTLKLFKEKNPGNVNPVIPLSLTYDVEWTASLILETFKQKATDEELYINQPFFIPGFKDGVKFLNKMYNEGLIAPEFPLDKDAKASESQIAKGQVGAIIGNYDNPLRVTSPVSTMMKSISGSKYAIIDCFNSPAYGNITRKPTYNPDGLRVIVPKGSSDKVDAAIKYLNWMSKKDNLFFLQFGEEGTHYKNIDGIPQIQTVDGEKRFNTNNNLDYTLIVNGVDLGDKDKNTKTMSLSYPGFEQDFIKAFNVSMTNGYTTQSPTVPADAEAKYGNTLKNKSYEIYAKLLTVKPADFDKTWESSMDEYLKIGGQEVIDGRKAAWKEQMGSK